MTRPAEEKQPDSVQDTVFSDDGPLPPARLGIRFLAFVMDAVLLLLVANFIILKYAWPAAYPEAYSSYLAWFDSLASNIASGSPIEAMSPEILEAFNYANSIQMTVFWIYFAIGEAFGGALASACFACVRSVPSRSPPPSSRRFCAGIKTISLLSFSRCLIGSLIAMRFNRRRQMGPTCSTAPSWWMKNACRQRPLRNPRIFGFNWLLKTL